MSIPRTRVEPVQEQLRSEILSGVLTPGTKLPLAELAARLGTSIGSVREALIRLGSEGLVVAAPQLGFRVTPVSEQDLRDLIETRCVLEGETFRRAIEDGSLEWESAVTAAYHRLDRTQHDIDGQRNDASWVSSHRQFHEALIEGCANHRLIVVTMQLRDAAELYRSSSVGAMSPEQSAQRDREHFALRNAALTRDALGGPEILREHIRMTAHYFNLAL
ncbi:GntR family transcriptional regulator [Glaciihabitans sp. UYNi722]|uniref:GntR family transcriptional regulator n=1 Tax=Glaciihabitans sp. UYNi722 TaxID=3156344 RepID=UPI003399E76B